MPLFALLSKEMPILPLQSQDYNKLINQNMSDMIKQLKMGGVTSPYEAPDARVVIISHSGIVCSSTEALDNLNEDTDTLGWGDFE